MKRISSPGLKILLAIVSLLIMLPGNVSAQIPGARGAPSVSVSETAAAWLPGFGYRKAITITGSPDGAQTNYQMLLHVYKGSGTDSGAVVYTGGLCNDDFSDLRFTKPDGTSLLDYWIETYASGIDAYVWIEFDSIAASPSSTNFYIYYGSSVATSESNGSATFRYFNHFDATDDLVKNGNGGTWTLETENSWLKFESPDSTNFYSTACKDMGYPDGRLLTRYNSAPSETGSPNTGTAPRFTSQSNYIYFGDYPTSNVLFAWKKVSGIWSPLGGTDFISSTATWYRMQTGFSGNSFSTTVFTDGYSPSATVGATISEFSTLTTHGVYASVIGAGSPYCFDFLAFANYAENEPIWGTWGTEETGTALSWLPNFGLRKAMTVTGSAAGAQTNYQLRLNVHKDAGVDNGADVYLDNHGKSDFSDIRFSKADGTSLLDYWIESYDSASAIVWVEFDAIPASPATASFYLYYGNPAATSASNGDNTFIFFDDFLGDKSKWTEETNGGMLTVSGGVLTIDSPANTTLWGLTDNCPKLYKAVTETKFAFYLKHNSFSPTANYDWELMGIRKDASNWVSTGIAYNNWPGYSPTYRYLQPTRNNAGSSAGLSGGVIGASTPVYLRLRYLSGVTYFDHSLDNLNWTNEASYSMTLSTRQVFIGSESATFHDPPAATFDNCYVTNCTENEPAWSTWGIEETDTSAWLPGYGLRKAMTVTGSAAGAQTNYQLRLNVHKDAGVDNGADVYLGNHGKSDFSDIRFSKADGTSLLDYWIESYDSASAIVWVEFDAIPASPATASFYLYYGNPEATSASNGNNTFLIFDDFSGDLSGWTIMSGSWAVDSGRLRHTGNGDSGMIKPAGFSAPDDLKMQARFNFDNLTWITLADLNVRGNENLTAGYHAALRPLDPQYGRWGLWYWLTNHWQNIALAPYTYAADTWYTMRIEAAGATIRGYLNDASPLSMTNGLFTSGTALIRAQIQPDAHVYIDDFFIAKYVSPEPLISAWGAEEPDNPPPTDGVTVSVNAPARVSPNANFTVSIDIANVNALDAATYTVTFNPSLFRLDGVAAGNIDGTTIPVDICNQIESGAYIIVQNLPGFAGVSGSGTLAVLTLRSLGPLGSTGTIDVSNGTLSDSIANGITATWTGDTVAISAIPGDANDDGRVNAIDITKVERIIARLDAATSGADANTDGHINAIDITKVERLIAGLN